MVRSAPEMAMQGVFRAHWDNSEILLTDPPKIGTGEYRAGDADVPAIIVEGGSEGPISGGDTGYSAMDGAGGGGMQRQGGACTVYCVAGTYDDLSSASASGGSLNPKQIRWQLYDHASQLLVNYQEETPMKSVAPGDATWIAEPAGSSEDPDYEFRIEFRARYLYDRHPNPPL